MTERLLTARELAELLCLSPACPRWHEAGRIPSFKLGPGVGGPVRFRASEVEAWLEECRRGPASQRPQGGGMIGPTCSIGPSRSFPPSRSVPPGGGQSRPGGSCTRGGRNA